MRERFRVLHYSENTDRTYTPWIRRFQEFVDRDDPATSTARDAKDFLTHLALRERVSASAQNQAFNALLYFFRHALRKDIAGLADTVRARRRKPLPVVLSRDEVRRLLQAMTGTTRLMAQLVYGSGIRSRECVTLRVQDFDFERRQLVVRAGKGDKDRVTLLPQALHDPLRAHLERVRRLHGRDLAEGHGTAWLPDALGRKLPGAPTDWRWQYAFPSSTRAEDERDGVIRRFHMSRSTLRKAIQAAAQQAGIVKRVGTHTLRHSFATHLLEDGVNIRVIQDLLGHRQVETTMIYTHVMQKNIDGVRSPLDAMEPAGSRGGG
jgi:integron integrase